MNISKSARSNKFPYPVNLVLDTEDKAPMTFAHQFNPYSLPSDFVASVEYVLSTLPIEEAQILRVVYGAHGTPPVTFTQASNDLGFSQMKTHRLVTDAWYRLRQEEPWKMMTLGITGYVDQLKAAAGEEAAVAAKEKADAAAAEHMEWLSQIPIEDMMLSERCYQILKRAGFKTVADVVQAGPKRVKCQRNCGKLSYLNIMKKLERFDVDLTAWQLYVDVKPGWN